jgi:hypothetical protein
LGGAGWGILLIFYWLIYKRLPYSGNDTDGFGSYPIIFIYVFFPIINLMIYILKKIFEKSEKKYLFNF